ncbi:serine/arginine repetitive matrix protein 2-like isoform X2 [Adelges cooleyi]|nr:serine/arginine repetitive matrix protein 2-like isoform X2 [Adelges cooleyi]
MRKYKNSAQNYKNPIQFSTNSSEDKYRNRWNRRSLSSSSSSRSSLSLSRKRKMSPSRLSDRRSLRRSSDRRHPRRSLSKSRTTSQTPRRRSPFEKSPSALDSKNTNKLRIKPPRPLHRRPNANVSQQKKRKSKAFGQCRNRQTSEKRSPSDSEAFVNSHCSMDESTSSESSNSPLSTSGSNRRTFTRSSKKGIFRKNDRVYTEYLSGKTSSSSAETYIKSEPCVKSEVHVKSEDQTDAVRNKLVLETPFRSRSFSVPRHSTLEGFNKRKGLSGSLARPVIIKTEKDKNKISHKKTNCHKPKSSKTDRWSTHKPFKFDLMAELNKPSTMNLSERFGRLARLGPRIPPEQKTRFNNSGARSGSAPYKVHHTD